MSKDFVHGADSSGLVQDLKAGNVLVSEDVEVEVATVHRVKGETHTATLHMETFYQTGGGETMSLSGSLSSLEDSRSTERSMIL